MPFFFHRCRPRRERKVATAPPSPPLFATRPPRFLGSFSSARPHLLDRSFVFVSFFPRRKTRRRRRADREEELPIGGGGERQRLSAAAQGGGGGGGGGPRPLFVSLLGRFPLPRKSFLKSGLARERSPHSKRKISVIPSTSPSLTLAESGRGKRAQSRDLNLISI